MSKFFIRKCFLPLFSNYCLAWKIFGERISAQKLFVKCCWNWRQLSISTAFYEKIFVQTDFHSFSVLKLMLVIFGVRKLSESCSWTLNCYWNWHRCRFPTKVFCTAFLYLHIVIFGVRTLPKNACKMLLTLATGVDFINILQAVFLYESVL